MLFLNFLNSLGCFQIVCTHAVCGVYVRIFPSMVLYFCSNVFGSLTFVAILVVFRATWSIRFFVFSSIVVCNPLYLTFNLSLTISIFFDFAPVFCCVREFVFVRFLGICGFRFILLDRYFIFRPPL